MNKREEQYFIMNYQISLGNQEVFSANVYIFDYFKKQALIYDF